ncbi:MAG: glycosyltransferase family 9 protein, partial [Candidatus Dadabacteria bacterium]|nr:glycosyltransferase family 9 protein [Candidatus Dadabacteria bacterium]
NKGYDLLLTHVLKDNSLKHEVERNLDVIRFLGGEINDDSLELWLDKDDEISAEQILREHGGIQKGSLIGLGIGAGAPRRIWPLGSFIELGKWLTKEYGAKVILIGSNKEKELGRFLKNELKDAVINTVGVTTLRQAAALLKRCDLFIGNDAGPMHMAVAVGTPVVELSCHPVSGSPFSANSPRRFSPWGVHSIILQPEIAVGPCLDHCIAHSPHCIKGIAIEQVKYAAADLLLRS